LLELVVVVVILGVVASIAIPRLASATDHASTANTQANIAQMEHSIEIYAAEHDNRSPADEPDGTVNPDGTVFVKRLVSTTDALGNLGLPPFGPYLREFPQNLKNGRRSIRIDGSPAGANTDGWRFDSTLRIIEPDDPAQAVTFQTIPNPGVSDVSGGTPVGPGSASLH
jgi:type II secretory pathway pseudopilin PulG